MHGLRVAAALCLMLCLIPATHTRGQGRGADADTATPWPTLHRGIALTGWFRFPGRSDPQSLNAWIDDHTIAGLRQAGFDFVRLAVDPSLLSQPGVPGTLQHSIQRLQRQSLSVIVSLHPVGWHLEASAADRGALFSAWRRLGALLAPLDRTRTLAELLNEPVFPHDAAAWQELQHRLVTEVRGVLPATTLVLTGNDWSSVDGLMAMRPEPDPKVLYDVHLYEPTELTSLAAWRQGLDRDALARLPFPVSDEISCRAIVGATDQETAGVAGFYCSQQWQASQLAAMLGRAAAWGKRYGVPVLLGEFGASAKLNRSARLNWISSVRQAAENASLAWAIWGYDDVMGFDQPRPPGAGQLLDPALLSALGLRAGR
jgi:endoglucanase